MNCMKNSFLFDILFTFQFVSVPSVLHGKIGKQLIKSRLDLFLRNCIKKSYYRSGFTSDTTWQDNCAKVERLLKIDRPF